MGRGKRKWNGRNKGTGERGFGNVNREQKRKNHLKTAFGQY